LYLDCKSSFLVSSCSQKLNLGPGYKCFLFENTPNWKLAQAVESEDTSELFKIVKTDKIDINFQESRFGKTLLMFAVGNDKEKSTEALLKLGANVNLRDSMDTQAIHEAANYITLKRHSLNILNLLISYRVDVNAVSHGGPYPVPLESAVASLSCAKLLLENGAKLYYKSSSDTIYNTYNIWFSIFLLNYDSSIFVARYLIVDKKMLIPNPITVTTGKHSPIDVFGMLNKLDFSNEPKKQEAKEEIINYLHKIGFPKNGCYKDNSSKKLFEVEKIESVK
jgi:hypothetical protein